MIGTLATLGADVPKDVAAKLKASKYLVPVLGLPLALGAGDCLQTKVDADVLKPVRPVGVNGQAFWNKYAMSYMYPPSLEFPQAKDDAGALVTVRGANGFVTTFSESSPTVSLERVWQTLPVGAVTVVSRGVTNAFWRQAPYRVGAYPKALAIARAAAAMESTTPPEPSQSSSWRSL